MTKVIKFNARFSYQYYTENGSWINTEALIELLAKEAGVEIVEEGDGTEEMRRT